MNREAMRETLRSSFEHPEKKAFYYSANSIPTASEKLNAVENWDWTPNITHQPPMNTTCTLALAFGCPPIKTSEGKEWVEPLIHDAAQVDDLELPDVHSGRTGEILRGVGKMISELPEDHLVREADILSPMSVAELMWDESFYIALIENPNAVHRLLEKITTFTISYVREQNAIAGKRLNAAGFPCIWSPPQGTMVSDDTISLMSPEMHREFSIPYINRLGRECGPLFYHSCTWRKPFYENIHQVENVRAFNLNIGNSDDPAEIIKEFSGSAVLALHLVKDMHLDNDVLKLGKNFADEVDFLTYILDAMQDNTTIHLWLSNVIQKADIIERIYELMKDRGYAP